MSNTLIIIYRIATALVAAQAVIINYFAFLTPSSRVVAAVFGVIGFVGFVTELVLQQIPSNQTPPTPSPPPKVG